MTEMSLQPDAITMNSVINAFTHARDTVSTRGVII
jgi:hypothetical protein